MNLFSFLGVLILCSSVGLVFRLSTTLYEADDLYSCRIVHSFMDTVELCTTDKHLCRYLYLYLYLFICQ